MQKILKIYFQELDSKSFYFPGKKLILLKAHFQMVYYAMCVKIYCLSTLKFEIHAIYNLHCLTLNVSEAETRGL